MAARLKPLHHGASAAKPQKRPGTIWVEPQVIADIAFIGPTEDGMLQHTSFKGLNA